MNRDDAFDVRRSTCDVGQPRLTHVGLFIRWVNTPNVVKQWLQTSNGVFRCLASFMLLWLLVGVAVAADGATRLVRVGNLVYAGDKTSVCFSDRFLTTVAVEAGVNVEKRMHAVHLAKADEIMDTAFVVMNGQDEFTLSDTERQLLKRYLTNGGFLLASAGCSSEKWTASFKHEIALAFGADRLTQIPDNHPVFSTLFTGLDLSLSHGGKAVFEGLVLDGRLVCLFSKEGLNDTEHTQGCCCCGGNEVRAAEEMVANTLVYALVE
jgi:hypothetical protein